VDYVAHGYGYVNEAVPEASVWVIIAKVPEMSPYPIGPACPEDRPCQAWAVNDYGVVMVSDQTGKVLRSITTFKLVPSPSPGTAL
jgi:hypothetical protein